jgi:hypothetical protein
MRTLVVAFVYLICHGHAELEARNWELENLERYATGELNQAELGMANVMRAMNDPAMRAEIKKMMEDPEVQQLMADPDFQEQARQAMKEILGEILADPTFQEQANQILAQTVQARKENKLATLLLAMSSAKARTTRGASNVRMETNADLRALAAKLNPAIGYFDPLNLGADGPDGRSEPLIGFLRHAEIKHGRVSMAAFIGFCVQSNGFRWGFEPFKSITTNSPLEQWDALPPSTRWNLILGVGFLEGWGELRGTGEPHYMRGGKPGYYPNFDEIPKDTLSGWYPGLNLWDPLKIYGKQSAETKARRLVVELNNGRLAMLAIMSFISEAKIPGSIPLLKGLVPPYAGDLVFPPGQYGWVGDFKR